MVTKTYRVKVRVKLWAWNIYPMSTLGKRIREARGKLSQDAFCHLISISKGSLGFYERDENLPKVDVALKICSATDVSVEWLLTGQGPMRLGEPKRESLNKEEGGRWAALEDERRELSTENRQLWKENASLRERVARLEEQVKALRIAAAAPPMDASPPTAPVSASPVHLPNHTSR